MAATRRQRFILVNAKSRGTTVKNYHRVIEQQSMNGTKTSAL